MAIVDAIITRMSVFLENNGFSNQICEGSLLRTRYVLTNIHEMNLTNYINLETGILLRVTIETNNQHNQESNYSSDNIIITEFEKKFEF